MGASSYLKQNVLDHVLGGPAFAVPTPWLALFTSDPGNNGANEVAYTGYARVDASAKFGAAGGSTTEKANNAVVQFAANGGSSVSVTHFGFFDAASGGNFLGAAALTGQPIAIANGATPEFAIAALIARLL